MGFVDVEPHVVVAAFERGELVDGGGVAIHRKDAFGDDPHARVAARTVREQTLQVCHVVVAETFERRAREADAVDDGGVHEFVGYDEGVGG